MSRSRGSLIIRLALALLIAAGIVIFRRMQGGRPANSSVEPPAAAAPGGKLVTTFRSEPRSFNRLVSARAAEQRITMLMQATLVRVNPKTEAVEPRLAREWTVSQDGLTWTLRLRQDVAFSDGAPFTADDVVFTFAALYDAKVASDMASSFVIGGKPIAVRAVDPSTVVLTLAAPYGPGLRLLDPLPILPRHKLDAALRSGTFREAWAPSTPPAEVVGLGPFMLAEATAGQRLRFVRNPHYWRRDDDGRTLPYLDEVDVEIIPDQNAEVLRLESGDVDVPNDFVRPEDIAALRDLEKQGKVRLVDAGVGLDPSALWFNLSATAPAAKDRPWLLTDDFRHGISAAVDRQAIVDTVYLGAAVPIGGPVTPGFGDWYLPSLTPPVHDSAKARTFFTAAGLTDRAGTLVDAAGKPAEFSVLTQKGRSDRERTAAMLQAQLKQAGLTVDVVAVDTGTLIGHVQKGDYDAMYYGPVTNSRDPSELLDFWMSAGAFHLWNPGQSKPATSWEAQMDDLMRKQSTSLDPAERRRLFAGVQKLFADHEPALYFAAPKAMIAVSARLGGVEAAALQPPVLWNADHLFIRGPATPKP